MAAPRSRHTRLAITSLAFMLVLVPLPVWKMSTGKWRSSPPWSFRPSTIAAQARSMAAARSPSTRPSSAFALAHADFRTPYARTIDMGTGRPLIGKLSTARCVLAPYSTSAGTSIVPMESFSVRVFEAVIVLAAMWAPGMGADRVGSGFDWNSGVLGVILLVWLQSEAIATRPWAARTVSRRRGTPSRPRPPLPTCSGAP